MDVVWQRIASKLLVLSEKAYFVTKLKVCGEYIYIYNK